MCINRHKVHVPPIERVVAATIWYRNTFIGERVNVQVWKGIQDVVVVISRAWKERHRAHRRHIRVEVVSLVGLVITDHVYEIPGVKNQSRLFSSESLGNDRLLRTAPSAIAEHDKRERSGTGCTQCCVPGGENILAVDSNAVDVIGTGAQS